MTRRRLGASYRTALVLLRPAMQVLTRRRWEGQEHLPARGGFVVCANHTSYADPLVIAHYLHDSGVPPRFLGKDSLFRLPVVGRLLRGAGQIPVRRGTADAALALTAAVQAVRAGECVVVYPEGTLTHDPDLWPMEGRTGAARIALATGCRVVPLAQWGAHELAEPPGARLHLLRRPLVRVRAGAPVPLDDLAGVPLSEHVLHEATARIMGSVTALLESLRDEPAPGAAPRRQAS